MSLYPGQGLGPPPGFGGFQMPAHYAPQFQMPGMGGYTGPGSRAAGGVMAGANVGMGGYGGGAPRSPAETQQAGQAVGGLLSRLSQSAGGVQPVAAQPQSQAQQRMNIQKQHRQPYSQMGVVQQGNPADMAATFGGRASQMQQAIPQGAADPAQAREMMAGRQGTYQGAMGGFGGGGGGTIGGGMQMPQQQMQQREQMGGAANAFGAPQQMQMGGGQMGGRPQSPWGQQQMPFGGGFMSPFMQQRSPWGGMGGFSPYGGGFSPFGGGFGGFGGGMNRRFGGMMGGGMSPYGGGFNPFSGFNFGRMY